MNETILDYKNSSFTGILSKIVLLITDTAEHKASFFFVAPLWLLWLHQNRTLNKQSFMNELLI